MISHVAEEALRYLGIKDPTEDLRRQAIAEAEALSAASPPRYIYRVCELDVQEDGILLRGADLVLRGELAARMLAQCDRAVILACTLGAGFDSRLLAVQARDMARAVILDACGSALVEQGCDGAEREIAARFPEYYLTDRFSPGYGDLPLELQADLCRALDTGRRLGVYVLPSLLMNPVKSVTAIIGLSDTPQPARIRGCAHCQMRDTCTLRKEGTSCAN